MNLAEGDEVLCIESKHPDYFIQGNTYVITGINNSNYPYTITNEKGGHEVFDEKELSLSEQPCTGMSTQYKFILYAAKLLTDKQVFTFKMTGKLSR